MHAVEDFLQRAGAGGADAFHRLRVDRFHRLREQLGQDAGGVDPQRQHAGEGAQARPPR